MVQRRDENKKTRYLQWLIQELPDGGANPKSGGASPLFGKCFAENCMKMKEIGPERQWFAPTFDNKTEEFQNKAYD